MLSKVRQQLLIISSFLMPTIVLASDPTGLFIFFVAIPLIFFSFLCLLTSLASGKGGVIFSSILLVIHLLIFMWGHDVGYMDSAGEWVLGSFALIVVSFMIALKKIQNNQKEHTTEEDSDKEQV